MAHFSFRNQFFNADPERALSDTGLAPRSERPTAERKSTHKGVYWTRAIQRWIADVYVKRKVVHLGEFSREDHAIEAQQRAAALLEAMPGTSIAEFRRAYYVLGRRHK